MVFESSFVKPCALCAIQHLNTICLLTSALARVQKSHKNLAIDEMHVPFYANQLIFIID